MKILVIEDSREKASEIADALTAAGATESQIIIVPDSQAAKEHLLAGEVFLLVLDLQIPKRFDKNPTETGGIDLLRWIDRRERKLDVSYIVALSAYGLSAEVSDELVGYGVPYVHYEKSNDRWRTFVSAYTRRALGSARLRHNPLSSENAQGCEVVILTTVEVELEGACRVFGCEGTPQIQGGESWYHGVVPGEMRIPCVIGQCTQMGMPAAAILTAKAVRAWSPRLIVMVGVCAGVRERVELGDIIVPDPAWDYGSGKLTSNGLLHPDPRPIPLGERIRTLVRSLSRSPELRRWHDIWAGDKPRTVPKVHLEPAASGAAVIQSETVVEGIVGQSRKTAGLDMESFGVYFAASNLNALNLEFLSVKSVVDFADPKKNDTYQHFSADISCRFASLIIQAWAAMRSS